MKAIIIEDVQPIIKRQTIRGRPSVYPFDQLIAVGQTFFVPDTARSYVTVSIAVARCNKRSHNRVFNAFHADKNNVAGTRVQRVK